MTAACPAPLTDIIRAATAELPRGSALRASSSPGLTAGRAEHAGDLSARPRYRRVSLTRRLAVSARDMCLRAASAAVRPGSASEREREIFVVRQDARFRRAPTIGIAPSSSKRWRPLLERTLRINARAGMSPRSAPASPSAPTAPSVSATLTLCVSCQQRRRADDDVSPDHVGRRRALAQRVASNPHRISPRRQAHAKYRAGLRIARPSRTDCRRHPASARSHARSSPAMRTTAPTSSRHPRALQSAAPR